jgi:hypothetical protein
MPHADMKNAFSSESTSVKSVIGLRIGVRTRESAQPSMPNFMSMVRM